MRLQLVKPASDPLRFLRLILPEQGWKSAAIKRPAGSFLPSVFAQSVEELLEILEGADQDGHTAYHACAAYREPRNDPPGTPANEKRYGRTKHNVLGAKAFWLDIDSGPGKPYRDQDEAKNALADFCRKCGLPTPICVASSERGLHVYWPLERTLDRGTWETYAQGLKRLCVAEGLDADPARTADIASVLRTPGTHNRKQGQHMKTAANPWLVTVDHRFLEIEPYPLERFQVLLADQPAAERTSVSFAVGEPPAHLLGRARRELSETLLAALPPQYPPASGELVAKDCGQLGDFRDKRGDIPEPLWHAGLGVLAFCEDGDRLAHDWSNGHPQYSHAETEERLERLKGFGPTTCEKLHSLNPAVCDACPHWGKIKSPIVLGRENEGPANTSPALTGWEWTQGGFRKSKSYINTALAIGQIRLVCRHDVFHNKKLISGDLDVNLGRELSDAACRAVRELIIARYGFDPGVENVREAAERACEKNRFNPVTDYLDALRWDGQKRLDRWPETHLGAEDTPFNRAVGRKMLIAAVRRPRQPGCKFDYIPVLEAPQGVGKSSTLRILAGGDENFSDEPLLHLDPRAQQEALEGVWIYELSDLAGLRKAEVEKVKASISRTTDKARPAYGRFRVDQARQGIIVGTTNAGTYLRDETGNRRFWPMRVGTIDLGAVAGDRDQLFAEAAAAEARGESLVFEPALYVVAAAEQEERVLHDPWEDLLREVKGKAVRAGERVEERIASSDLLAGPPLLLTPDRINNETEKRVAPVMRRLGWSGPKVIRFEREVRSADGKPTTTTTKELYLARGYWRPLS